MSHAPSTKMHHSHGPVRVAALVVGCTHREKELISLFIYNTNHRFKLCLSSTLFFNFTDGLIQSFWSILDLLANQPTNQLSIYLSASVYHFHNSNQLLFLIHGVLGFWGFEFLRFG